jgi:hypothetical protein
MANANVGRSRPKSTIPRANLDNRYLHMSIMQERVKRNTTCKLAMPGSTSFALGWPFVLKHFIFRHGSSELTDLEAILDRYCPPVLLFVSTAGSS